jgi:hypothetical protein
MWPLTQLPWIAFVTIWFAAAACALWWLLLPLRPSIRVPLLIAALAWSGNAAVFVALAIASRHAAAWALVLLTKITPGVGVLWYAIRREWRALATTLAATAAIVAVSFAADPSLWTRWAQVVLSQTNHPGLVVWFLPQIPLIFRVVGGAGLVGWGAMRNRAWVLPMAALIANPDILASSLPLLAAVPRLITLHPMRHSPD